MKIELTVEELKELLKKEHSECKSECSEMLKKSMLYIFKAFKEKGLNNTDEFIDFWERY